MHELSITKELVKQILSSTKQDVIEAIIDLGLLTSFKKDPILYYFEAIQKEHKQLKKTKLSVNLIKGKLKCNDCNVKSIVNEAYMILCPECNSGNVNIIEGQELILRCVKTVDVEL